MRKAQIYNTDGTIVPVEPKNGKDFQLAELQQIVEGYIEAIPLSANDASKDLYLICNEDGKSKNLPINNEATKLLRLYFGNTDFVVGNVLVCSPEMFT